MKSLTLWTLSEGGRVRWTPVDMFLLLFGGSDLLSSFKVGFFKTLFFQTTKQCCSGTFYISLCLLGKIQTLRVNNSRIRTNDEYHIFGVLFLYEYKHIRKLSNRISVQLIIYDNLQKQTLFNNDERCMKRLLTVHVKVSKPLKIFHSFFT